jgi:hypothetical protein
MAEKLRLNDDGLSCGTLDDGDVLPEVGVVLDDVVDEPLLPQPAATKAAQAASAVRAIDLLLIKPNETTSF